MQKRLTIGMPCYSDADGVYFTITALRLYHPEVMDHVQLLVVDGNPDSEHGKATAHFCSGAGSTVRYIRADGANGTAQTKEQVFVHAQTEFVMCMDCHVLMAPGSIAKLINTLESDDGNLLQGPLVYDDMRTISTHFDQVWRGGMLGVWATDERGREPGSPPFEINAQGMGVFACRRDAWPSFHPLFRGFGGEECYIHEKFRQMGKTTFCLPFLRWSHRFGRPGGIPYQNILEDRIFNYTVGHLELRMPLQPISDHFSTLIGEEKVLPAMNHAAREYMRWMEDYGQSQQITEQVLCTA